MVNGHCNDEKGQLPSPPSVVIDSELVPTLPPTSTIIQRRYIRISATEEACTVDIDSLTLMEKILLIGLNDKQGHLPFFNDSISYVLRGCILIELALRGRIQSLPSERYSIHPKERHIEVLYASEHLLPYTGDPILDEALRAISSESHSVSSWVDLLSGESWNPLKINFQLKNIRERILKGLVDKGVLGTNKKTVFLVLEMATHPVVMESKKAELANNLKQELFSVSESFSDPAIGILGATALAARVIQGVVSSMDRRNRQFAISKASKWLKDLTIERADLPDIVTGIFSIFSKMDSLTGR